MSNTGTVERAGTRARIALVALAAVAVAAVVVVSMAATAPETGTPPTTQTAPPIQWPVPVAQDPAIAKAAADVASGAQSSALNLQIIGLLTLIFNGLFVAFGLWMAFKQRALELGQQQATDSAKRLEAGQREVKVVTDSTHTLVNTAYGIQLRLVATALRRLAESSRKKQDKQEAAEALQLYEEHMKKQGAVDAHAATVAEAAEAEAKAVEARAP